MILTITIEVKSKGEAYNAVASASFEHKVLSADLDGYTEQFDKTNHPVLFMKDNKKVKRTQRDELYKRKSKKV